MRSSPLRLLALPAALTSLALGLAFPARAQRGPVSFLGPERVLSTGFVLGGDGPAVGPGGPGFITAWGGGIEDLGAGVLYRLVDPEGVPVGEPRLGSSIGRGKAPGLAPRPGGAFALTQWELRGNDRILRLGRYRPDGAPESGLETLSEPQRVGVVPPPSAVAGSPASGRLVAAWGRAGNLVTDRTNQVAALVLSSAGTPVRGRIEVSELLDDFGDVDVAMADDGAFLVAWSGRRFREISAGYRVFLRRYDAGGEPLGPAMLAPAQGDVAAMGPAVAGGIEGGGFAVAYSTPADGSERRLWLRRLDPDGTLSPAVEVSAFAAPLAHPSDIALAADADGSVLLAWTHVTGPGAREDVFARAFDSQGVPLSERFRLHADPAGTQRDPAVTAVKPGRFAVAWTSTALGEGTEVRGRILEVDPERGGGNAPPPRALTDAEITCDEARLRGLLARLEVEAPGTETPPGVVIGFTPSGDFAGVAHVASGPATTVGGFPESLLTFAANPEETPLLRNPERPTLASVSLARIPPASDLVEPGFPGHLRVILNPTLELRSPNPRSLLRIDNLAGPANGGMGVSADAKPGRGLADLLDACHQGLTEADTQVLHVLQRIVRGGAEGAERFEVAVYRGTRPGLFRIDLYPRGPDGTSLGRLAAELEVERTPGGLLWTGELRSRPRCGEGSTRGCTSVTAPTVLQLMQPTFGRPTEAPRKVRLEASGANEPPTEIRFLWDELLAGSTWLGGVR